MPDSVRVGTSANGPVGVALLARDGEHPQLAGLDLAVELGQPGEADVDLLAEQGAGQRAAAVVGDVVDVVGVDADLVGQLHREQVVRPARRRAAADGDRAGVVRPGLRPGRRWSRTASRPAPGPPRARSSAGPAAWRPAAGTRCRRSTSSPTTPSPTVIIVCSSPALPISVGHRAGAAGADHVVDRERAAGDVVVLHHLHGRAAGLVVAAAGAVGDDHQQVAAVVAAGDPAGRHRQQQHRGRSRRAPAICPELVASAPTLPVAASPVEAPCSPRAGRCTTTRSCHVRRRNDCLA